MCYTVKAKITTTLTFPQEQFKVEATAGVVPKGINDVNMMGQHPFFAFYLPFFGVDIEITSFFRVFLPTSIFTSTFLDSPQ
jgi:hypothetical protein